MNIVSVPSPVPDLRSPDLWATVDICDTAAHPDTIGIRGSMPGTGDRAETMFMSFRIEYRDKHRVWHDLAAGGASRLAAVGRAAARVRQAGVSFTIAASTTRRYVLRGVVTFEWRLGSRTVATATLITTAAHAAGAGADPPGYSASVCTIAVKRRGSFVITPVTPSAASRAISAASSTVHG